MGKCATNNRAFAQGGMIKGPGTSISDSIPAEVQETGEPIAVSTGERIVSKEQDALLQKIASGMGYDSLDAMLEAGTGKPVGPTIKGGVKHAAFGANDKQLTSQDLQGWAPRQPAQPPAEMNRETSNVVMGTRSPVPPPAATSAVPGVTRTGNSFAETPVAPPAPKSIADLDAKRFSWSKPGANAIGGVIDAIGNAVTPASVPAYVGKDERAGIKQMDAVQQAQSSRVLQQPQYQEPETSIGLLDAPQYNSRSPEAIAANPQQPSGDGTINGKAVHLPKDSGYVDAQGNPVQKWEQTERYAQAMQVNDRMTKLANQMERDRHIRDMGPDIKDNRTIAIAKLNLDRMDKEQGAQQASESAGVERQAKQQQIAQLGEANALQKKVMDGDQKAIEGWNRLHPQPQEEFGAIALKETDPVTMAVTERLQPYSKRTGLSPAAMQAKPVSTPSVAVGTPVKAPDGTHTFQGQTIVVKDGKITGVK